MTTKTKGRLIIWFSILFLVIFLIFTSGCNTMHGIGTLMRGIGADIQGAAGGTADSFERDLN